MHMVSFLNGLHQCAEPIVSCGTFHHVAMYDMFLALIVFFIFMNLKKRFTFGPGSWMGLWGGCETGGGTGIRGLKSGAESRRSRRLGHRCCPRGDSKISWQDDSRWSEATEMVEVSLIKSV